MEVPKKEQVIREEGEEEIKRKGYFHVLAVDDSLIERKMLEKLLTISSYHVTCVESGDKALEYLGLVDRRPHNFDDHDHDHHGASAVDHSLPSPDHLEEQGQGTRVNLIMTDYSMPGISGYDLLKRVKGSSWKDVPVVVMSSENVPSRIDMCLEGGAEDFLLKPVKLSDLKKLQPHILKSTSTKDYTGENRTSLVPNNNNNINFDYKEEIMVNEYASGYDKGKGKIDGEHFDRRPQLETLTTV